MIEGFRIDVHGNCKPRSFGSAEDLRWYLTHNAQGKIRKMTPSGNKLNSSFLVLTDGEAKEKHLPINKLASRLGNMEIYGSAFILRRSADGRNIFNLTDDDKRYLQLSCEQEKKSVKREIYMKESNKTALADNVRHHRKRMNLTQLELGRMVGYRTDESIGKVERGIAPPPKKIAELAEVFGISVEELVGEAYAM